MSRASLAIDEGIKEKLATDVRALKLTADPKRPRWVIHESIPRGPSLKDDFTAVCELLKEGEPAAVLVHLQDSAGTLPAADNDWMIIAWIPEDLPDPAVKRHLLGTTSLREKLVHLRLNEMRVGNWMELDWLEFFEKASDVISGKVEVISPPNRKRGSVVQRMKEFEAARDDVDAKVLSPARPTVVDTAEQWAAAVSSLERFSGSPLAKFQPWVIVTNFQGFLDAFAAKFGVPISTGSSWRCAHCPSEKVSILHYNAGSPNAALVIDILGRIDKFELVIFSGMVGALPQCSDFCHALQLGEAFVPTAAVRADGISDHYLPASVPAVPDMQLLWELMQAVDEQDQGGQSGVVYTMNVRDWEFDAALQATIRASLADAVDMDTASIFAAARRHGIKAAALHLVSDTPFEAPKDADLANRLSEELAPAHVSRAVKVLKEVGGFLGSDAAEAQRYRNSRSLKASTG